MRTTSRSRDDGDDVMLCSTDTTRKLWGKPWMRQEPVSSPSYNAFCRAIKTIQDAGEAQGMSIPTTLVLLNRHYAGMTWDTIEYGQCAELAKWVQQNAFRFFEIVEPAYHAEYMRQGGEYAEWYNRKSQAIAW